MARGPYANEGIFTLPARFAHLQGCARFAAADLGLLLHEGRREDPFVHPAMINQTG